MSSFPPLAAPEERPADRNFLRGVIVIGIALVVYGALSVLVYWPLPLLSSQRIVTCGCNDLAEQAWFIGWTHYSIDHGINPLWSGWLNYPYGVNLAENTSMPLIGILAFPLTTLFGPVAALDFMMRFAFFASSVSMFLTLRTFIRSASAAFLGGLLYGFSAYMIGQGNGHLNLMFIPLPPLIFLLLSELLVRQRHRPWIVGIVLGAVCILQFFVSTELLASCAILSALGLVVLLITFRQRIRQQFHHAFIGLVCALATFLAVVGYPIWFLVGGPQHLNGPAQPISGLWAYRSDLLGPIVPTVLQRLAPAHLKAIGTSFAAGNVTDDGIYIGIPLLLFVAAATYLFRRNTLVRSITVMALIVFILSLGPGLIVDNHDTHIPLPFDLLRNVPLLQSQVPDRYSLFVQLFVAAVLAIGLDRMIASTKFAVMIRTNSHYLTSRFGVNRIQAAGSVLLGAALLVPLIPALSYPTPSTEVPSFFSSALIKGIPPSSVLLAYPYPVNPNNVAMLWQANDAMQFKLLGDYAIVRDGNGNGSTAPPTLSPSVVQVLFDRAMNGPISSVDGIAPLTPKTIATVQEFMIRYSVATVVVDPVGVDPSLAIRYLTKSLGAPRSVGGVDVWFDVQHLVEVYRGAR